MLTRTRFTPSGTGTIFDYMYTEPPLVTSDPISVLQIAHGLRHLADLEPRIWLDSDASLSQLVDGKH